MSSHSKRTNPGYLRDEVAAPGDTCDPLTLTVDTIGHVAPDASRRDKLGRPPTMRDVGRLAGVSQSTVSFVVNGRADEMGIAVETRAKVKVAIEQLGFRPDQTARALRLGRTQIFGLLSDKIATSPFAGRILLGAQDEALQNGRLLLMVNTGLRKGAEDAAVEALLDQRVDAMIYAAQSPVEVRVPQRMSEVPLVLVNCFDAGGRFPAVLPDEIHGGYLAARAALDEGHQELRYLAGHPDVWATGERVAGFLKALEEAGVPIWPETVSYGDYDSNSGYDRTAALVRDGGLPTALLCANDRVALGALFALRDAGIDVPRDISVVGYDDQEHLADMTHPALTTVSLPHYELGARGVRMLLDSSEQGQPTAERTFIRGTLVRRATLGPRPDRARSSS